MSDMDKIKKQMQELIEKINLYNYHYYTLDEPLVSDKEYDAVYYELVDLEARYDLVLPNSPTQRVGDVVLKNFEKHQHEFRLYSLSKVRDFEDLEKWVDDMRKVDPTTDFALEYKYDGLQLVLEYEDGKFFRATTRGDGTIGENVTMQVKTISSVPLEIKYKGRLIVQGEGMMTKSALKRYNRTADIPLKNTRNGVAGAIRNLDTKETAKRKLDFFCYSIIFCENKFESQIQMHEFLIENGFNVGSFFHICKNPKEIEKLIVEVGEKKSQLDIDIDGMVIKVNDVAPRDEIGYTNKFPKWAMAFKFEAEEISTMLEDVVWQVGRSGKVTPTAILEPVELAGATISRATLNNIEDIRKKQVSIGSRVFIRRSNEVIPEVLGLAEKMENSKEILEPKKCPCCGSVLQKKGPLIFCRNQFGCKQQIVSRLTHFVSREAFNIEGLSEKTLEQFYDDLSIRTFSGLFDVTVEQLVNLEKFAEKKAENVLKSLQKCKKIEFFRFLYALGINEVGIKTAKDLAKRFKNLNALKNASLEEIDDVEDVGEVIAKNIFDYFQDEANLQEIDSLLKVGIEIVSGQQAKSNKFEGMTFVLTGTLPNYSRNDMTKLIEENGGKTASSVSKNTTYVLAGDDAGSKLDKAKSLGVKVIDEAEILRMIKD